VLYFTLPTDRIDYLQLTFPANGLGLIARWGTQFTPITVGVWDSPGTGPIWQRTDQRQNLSPDGEWVSAFDKEAREVRITRVGAPSTFAVLSRDATDNVWTAVAPGGAAVAWKDDSFTVVRALPGGEDVVRMKTGWGVDLRFSPGGRWLTEMGERVFRVFDRTNNYRSFARIPTPRHKLADITDGLTAVVTSSDRNTVSVWDLSSKSATASFKVAGWVSALAISADGKRVLTGDAQNGEVTLWDVAGAPLQQYAWGVKTPIAAAFSQDGTRAAIGGTDGRIVVWDLDD